MKEKWENSFVSIWFIVVLCIIVVVVSCLSWWGIDNIYSKKKQEAIDTPPSEFDIEEELEAHLASTDVIIIDSEQDDGLLLVKVWANGGIHLATYKIKTIAQFYYYWKLVDVKMIGVGERP